MKKALAIISFGTSYETGVKAIERIEQYMEKEFKEYDCFRAFTSNMILAKLKRQGIDIPTTKELLESLVEQGYEEVICQPTHIIHGFEFDKMMDQIQPFKTKFKSLKVGNPMLHEEEDYRKCVMIYEKELPYKNKEEALVLMGHGSEHHANSCYCQMEKMFQLAGREDIYIGTVEGFPMLSDVMGQLEGKKIKKVTLAPFMIVAGDHAANDMAGEEEDSWKCQFEKAGYEVDICMKGLGEYEGVAELYAEHIRKAEEIA